MNTLFVAVCLLAITAQVVTSSGIPIVDHPRYAFNYAVNDPLTKDKKAQWEIRNGNNVKGSYSLVEPDGGVRVVDYTAGAHGFNAIVRKAVPNLHPLPLLPKVPLVHNLPLLPIATPVTPLIAPLNYGFGAAPITLGIPKAASLGHWSLPWDPLTHSFGGWRPISGSSLPLGPHATIFSKKVVGGKVHRWTTGPIPFYPGTTLVFKKKH